MRKVTILTLLLMALVSLSLSAQEQRFLRGNCMPSDEEGQTTGAAKVRRNLTLKTDWDASRTYPVAVVLLEFVDREFSVENPATFYDRLFNEDGFTQRHGKGCVAEYFRDQSAGLFKPVFDIYGPVKVSSMSKSSSSGANYGKTAFNESVKMIANDNPELSFAKYDWNGDGICEAIVFVYAGCGGNDPQPEAKGCVWPNTGSFSTFTVGNTSISNYSASAELWAQNSKSCGIGTICHEFSHTLGLPDIYPTDKNATEYSILDEFDLMDGGNFSDQGWCPPNLSVHEKMLLGWYVPEELTTPVTIEDLKPMADGGKAFIIRNDDNMSEFYLLENRQWSGWDNYIPGHGLLITHVDYVKSKWTANSVNNVANHHYYDLVHADNNDYMRWDDMLSGSSSYKNGRNLHLSTSPYPYVTDDNANRSLTDSSVPAATTYTISGLLSKPITDIFEHEDGTVSFCFMSSMLDAIVEQRADDRLTERRWYDLQGRQATPHQRGIVISSDGRKRINP